MNDAHHFQKGIYNAATLLWIRGDFDTRDPRGEDYLKVVFLDFVYAVCC